ncbi:ribonuclease III family protein [Phocea massiliensis]|uniref:Ribonuclease 3 n=1 Tax=Merdimmobilis hominis TaxID=2897707 RepID=A0A938XAA5_9FIRM|nr:ribonuclease III domain-containing protein [Merdimmobilis hominis]MBM6921514.1 ribonuclease III family protein [Merdimmobilis hominis]
MKKELVWEIVQRQIGYEFKNLDLLKQAFTRRSYTEEKGGENNEVLEFIGDKALDFAVVKLLIQKYGHLANGDPVDGTKLSAWEQNLKSSGEQEVNSFSCDYNEDELSKTRSRMVNKKTLAQRMDELGFSEHLIMGKGDVQQNINQEDSVKEDLFEAIIGAVAIDCGWDQNKIQLVVEAMLVPEDFLIDDIDTNYVRLIQEWEWQKNGCIPWYKYIEASYQMTWYIKEENTIYQRFPLFYDYHKLKYHCYLKLLDSLPIFCGFGVSVREARMAACKLAYEYLDDHNMLFTIRDEIDNPNRDMAVNQLETLARRGYFSLPTYTFKQTYDDDGNPIWNCECHIEEEEYYFDETSSSKKAAKKGAAYSMLMYVLGMEE